MSMEVSLKEFYDYFDLSKSVFADRVFGVLGNPHCQHLLVKIKGTHTPVARAVFVLHAAANLADRDHSGELEFKGALGRRASHCIVSHHTLSCHTHQPPPIRAADWRVEL